MSEPGDKKPEGQEETVWDSTYDDPSADTVFVSSDNVRFRVHSWQLKKKSGFVAGMFGVATHGDLTESPLQLDAPASIVRIFLDAMFISGNPSIHTDPEEFNVLLALCERCQSPEVEDKLFDCLIRSPILKKYPFQFFVLAAKTDRPALAKSAAEVLQEDQDHSDILSWSADEVNEIGARYFMALLKACMEGRCGGLFIGSDVGRHLERFIQSSRRTEK